MTEVWVKTEPSVDGSTYVVTIEAGEDRAVTLAPENVMRYAAQVLAAAEVAEYDAIVFQQLAPMVGPEDAKYAVVDLRKDRPPLDPDATRPLTMTPGVTKEAKPFLTISLDDEPLGQWTIEDARNHAMFVIASVMVADLDAGYYRALRNTIGLDENTARNVVADLAQYRSVVT